MKLEYEFDSHEITGTPREVTGTLDRTQLRTYLGEEWREDGDLVAVRLSLYRRGNTVCCDGSITGRLITICSRCAEEMKRELDVRFLCVFTDGDPSEISAGEGIDVTSVDPQFYDAEEGVVDFSVPMFEELALGVEDYPLCRESCKGLCHDCGADLNVGGCTCSSISGGTFAGLGQLLDQLD